jgi:HEPN domain-containing protein
LFFGHLAIEKILKALLTERNVEFKRTHNIIDLLALLKGKGFTVNLSHEEAGFLTAVYRSRYPVEAGLLPHGEPLIDDAGKALAIASRVVAEGKRMLGAA